MKERQNQKFGSSLEGYRPSKGLGIAYQSELKIICL